MSLKRITKKVGNVVIPIYRTRSKGYSGFTVAWYKDGRRCRKFFAKEREAREHARLIATIGLSLQEARMYVWASSELKPFGLTLDAAAREIAAARKILGDYPYLQALQFWKRHHDDATLSDKTT